LKTSHLASYFPNEQRWLNVLVAAASIRYHSLKADNHNEVEETYL
jgi:hypothetical protein